MSTIPPAQRVSKLKQHATSSANLRPVLTSINGNVAWIISFPYPSTEPAPASDKKYYHALMDPWFGEEIVFASYYFLRMHLCEPPALKDRSDVEDVIREIEVAAGGDPSGLGSGNGNSTLVDGIFIAGRVEHCSKTSLIQFSPRTPVFVTSLAHAMVMGWKHFDTVIELKNFMPSYGDADKQGEEKDKCWTDAHTGSPLPRWLCAMMLQTSGVAQNNFAMVMMYSSQNDKGEDVDEAIVVAAHGVSSAEQSIATLFQQPRTSSAGKGRSEQMAPKLLALLAPYNESFQLNTCVTFGSDEALAVAQYPEDGMKYYVANGDTPLVLNGLLSWTQSYLSHDLEWGRQQLMMGKGTNGIKYDDEYKWKLPIEAFVGNGETYILT